MSARDAIFAALAPASPADPVAIAAEARAWVTGLEHPVAMADGDLAAFLASLAVPSIAATHATIADWHGLPGEVARYLRQEGEPAALYLSPDPRLDALDWQELERLPICPVDGGAALGLAVAAVAETGSLVLDTATSAPMLPNFLALHHLIVVEAASIVRWLEDIPPPTVLPRQRTWVTGVSGTTDIEGQYVRGAHGPRFLHVIVIDGGAAFQD